MLRGFILSACLLFQAALGFTQENVEDFEQRITRSFLQQLYFYPQEKVYLHFDRNHYIAGDTIWFRGYVMNASSHIPDGSSRYLYVDLQNQTDSVIQRLAIRKFDDGTFCGHFPLSPRTAEGQYTVWGYTMFMRNAGPDYFFQAPIRISEPRSGEIKTEVDFHREPKSDRLDVRLSFAKRIDEQSYVPHEVRTSLNQVGLEWSADLIKSGNYPFNEYLRTRTPNESGQFLMNFRKMDTMKNHVLLIDYDESQRFLTMPPAPAGLDVTFHPEGGHLIAGVLNKVAFKALNTYGQGEYITGEIFDSQGNKSVDFQPVYKGMGTFALVAQAGEKYHAVCRDREGNTKRFDLPEVHEKALGLKITDRPDHFIVQILRPAELDEFDSLFLIVQNRGKPLHAGPIGDGKKQRAFAKEMFPSGVSHFILVDDQNRILSERLVFVRHKDRAQVSFSTDKPAYGKRQAVQSTVQLNSSSGNPVMTSFSVAVTDDADLMPDSTRNIFTELLLASDLRGYIDSPAWYFEPESPDRTEALDALLLTQGWRRYELSSLLQGETALPEFPLEIGRLVSGRVKALRSSRVRQGTPVNLFITRSNYMDVTETDEQGRFSFTGFEIPEGGGLFIQALSQKGKHNVEMILDDDISLVKLPGSISGWSHRPFLEADELNYLSKGDQRWIMKNGMRTIMMDPIQVKGRRENWWEDPYLEIIDKRFEKEDLEKMEIQSLWDLIFEIPSVWIEYYVTNEGELKSRPKTSNGPVVFRIQDQSPYRMDPEFNWETDVDMSQVERIDFVYGSKAKAFGMTVGGAILITTVHGRSYFNKDTNSFNRKRIKAIGVQKPAEFYSPKYETVQQRNTEKPDLRTTVYWNPAIQTDEKGNASFEFYTADSEKTTYSVVIEGVTPEGEIIRSVEKIVCD